MLPHLGVAVVHRFPELAMEFLEAIAQSWLNDSGNVLRLVDQLKQGRRP